MDIEATLQTDSPRKRQCNNIEVLQISSSQPTSTQIKLQNEGKDSVAYSSDTKKVYRLMPHTRIRTISTKYRVNNVKIEPEVLVTVIAEFSNFASNAFLLPLMMDFPTMEVLLQGIAVNIHNVSDTISNIQWEFEKFLQKIAEFRQKIRKESPESYVMDILKNEDDPESNLNYDKKNKNDIWRPGSGGANISFSLNEVHQFREWIQGNVNICKRPLTKFVVRNYIKTEDERLAEGRARIVRSYLRHKEWSWLDDFKMDFVTNDENYLDIRDLAFQYLCKARLDEGCYILYEKKNRGTFYQEIDFTDQFQKEGSLPVRKAICGVQHILKLSFEGIKVELWMEPPQHLHVRDAYDAFVSRIEAADRLKLSQLVTFDQIIFIAETRAKQPSPSEPLVIPSLFNLPALLRSSEFKVANYPVPSFLPTDSPSNTSLHRKILSAESPARGSNDRSRTRRVSVNKKESSEAMITPKRLPLSMSNYKNYSIDPDQIAALKTLDWDLALLHISFEKTLSKYSNWEIDTTDESCKGSLIEDMGNELLNDETSATTIRTNDLRESRCFVKVINSNTFLLIFVPSFTILINEMVRKNGEYIENKPCYLSLPIFLCERQRPIHGDSKERLNSFGLGFASSSSLKKSSLAPKIIEYPTNKNQGDQEVVADRVVKVNKAIEIVTSLFSRGFVKSIYASILQRRRVQTEDFSKAVDACEEINIDIDITGYVNVHVLGSRLGAEKEDESEVYQKFVAVLGHYFEPVCLVGNELQYTYYYYRVKKSSSLITNAIDNVDIAGNFLDIYNCAENPLFIRLECIFRKPLSEPVEEKEFETVQFPVSSLPTTYIYKDSVGKCHDFSPESIGTEASPVESSDGTKAILRIICLTLPSVEEIGKDDHGIGDKSGADDDPSNTAGLSLLTVDKRKNIDETKDRIDWLLKEEIMHELLKTRNVNQSVLAYVQKQLRKKKNPYVDFPTTFTVPLSFVRKSKGPTRFLLEFSKADMKPFSLNQVEECFYISMDGEIPESLETATPNYDDGSENTETHALMSEARREGKKGIASGLGISFSHPSDRENISDPADKSTKKNVAQKQLFWLLLIPQGMSIQVYFYSKALNSLKRSLTIQHIRKCIVDVSERVNQLILLEDLHEKRHCSKYLVPPDDPSGYESLSEDEDQPSAELSSNESQITGKFKIVPPNKALSGIGLSLNTFCVLNRKDMFVYTGKKSIVYFKIYEVESNVGGDDLSTLMDNNATQVPLQTTNSEAGNISCASPNTRKPGEKPKTTGRDLVVKVFGLNISDEESKEIMGSLMSMLETSQTALLKKEDIEFILPVHKDPRRLRLAIPTFIKNLYAFLVYFNQNLSFYLRPLSGKDVAAVIKHHHNRSYGGSYNSDGLDSEKKAPYDIQLHEFSFCYNFNYDTRSHVELSVGQGIAGICLTLLDRNGRPIYELTSDQVDTSDTEMSKIVEYISQEENIFCDDSIKYDYRLLVELWTESSINWIKLFEYVQKSFRQCLCDYFLEIAITQGLGRAPETEADREHPEDHKEEILASNHTEKASAGDHKEERVKEDPNKKEAPAEGHKEEVPVCEHNEGISADACEEVTSAVEYFDFRAQQEFIKPSLELIKKAANLENPALSSMNVKLDMPSWMMDDFLREVQEVLSSVHAIFTPIILRTKPFIPSLSTVGEKDKYEIYRPRPSSMSTKDRTKTVPRQYLIIAGLNELNQKYQKPNVQSRRGSSDESHSRKLAQRRLLEDIMEYTIKPFHKDNIKTSKLFRSCFLFMTIDGFDLSIYIYNWKKHQSDNFYSAMRRITDWHNKRVKLLNNILHQKMGLFYHSSWITFKPQSPHNTPKSATMTTDLTLVNSFINERFPSHQKLDARGYDFKKSSVSRNVELEVNRVTLTASDLNEVLKDSYIELLPEEGRSSEDLDVLKRHGLLFTKEWSRQNEISQAHDNARNVYDKWKKSYEENVDMKERTKQSDIDIILRTSRVLLCGRAKFLLNDKLPHLYDDMVQRFFDDYRAFLEGKMGMQLLPNVGDDGDLESFTSKYSETEKASDEHSSMFLLKALQGGTIICYVEIQGDFVSVTLYVLNRRYDRIRVDAPSFASNISARDSVRVFAEECGKFKKMIRVNTFIYDFHLRYIKYLLKSQSEKPLAFDIIEFIRNFSLNASRTRHRIYRHNFKSASDSIPEDLFDYILGHPQYFGFHSISYDGSQSTSPNEPCIMILSLPQTDEHVAGRVSLEYHVIVFYDNDGTSQSVEESRYEMKSRCDHKLDLMTQQATTFYRRDRLWDQLRALDRSNNSYPMTDEDLKLLIELCHSHEIDAINSDFKNILTISPSWTDVLDFLSSYYAQDSRKLSDGHLVIFDSNNRDIFIHFHASQPPSSVTGVNNLMVNLVSKENEQDQAKVLSQFVSDIIVTVSYWLWKKLI
ncbi:14879_t:CDS:10 [Acaulospora colombiana]|uniref:14879_t:CDS:1 n=1 Tax=Acaulospora colombiana TaxID=27376 RepID=A0ACA9KSB9_9GLOM|nr:14879_t:CDS:10 [Acaulospora colombiana]